ncbi:SMI1/KNR4 family protein [Zooshikella ganghwensis]|uniref:SMI1/KNR4 family protein n=1 Tax=Zooshikella ganghwensis TaxID=202772 RepID=UPI000417236E|nr:SMI1/KNR4 family protein [Zooshikella ganghwensis]
MNFIDVLENFGITKLGDEGISAQDIDELENEIGCELPEDYKFFLQKYGESDLESWVKFPTEGGGVYPGTFLGLDIIQKIEDCSERLPDKCIPINDDGDDNLILLSLDQSCYGQIYFQHHSIGVGGALNTNENKWKTTAFLAKDFSSFICGLELDE